MKARRPLHSRILIGLVLGIVVGLIARATLDPETAKLLATDYATPVGSIFLNMIFMVVVPLLFAALTLGVSELGAAARIGRVGLKCLAFTVLLSGIAVAIGLAAVNIARPGDGFPLDVEKKIAATNLEKTTKSVENSKDTKSAGETIAEMIPKNPLESAVQALQGGLLPFMVFALIFGIALAGVEPEVAAPLRAFLESLFQVCLRVIEMAMTLAPIGVFALIYSVSSTLGLDALTALAKYVVVVLLALTFHQFVVYSAAIKLFAKRSPAEFFRQIRQVMLTAFSTSSSNATLPTALTTAELELGLPRKISNFILTIGATANQNGTALFEGITVLFLAQVHHVSLSLGQQLVVMGLAILAGVGTAGVPGGSWPMIAVILAKIGVPPESIGLCIGVDRILDMSRTVLNVTGDLTIAACVAATEPDEPAWEALT